MKRYLLALLSFLIFLLAYLFELPMVHWLELKSIDWRFDWRGSQEPTGEVVVVAIDEKSLNVEGRWPWPREKMAALIRRIDQGSPQLVEMDIVFAESSPDDAYLAEALAAKKNVILGFFFYQNARELEAADLAPEKMEEDFNSILPTAFPEISGLKEQLPKMAGVIANTPQIAAAAKAQGYFNAFPDRDGVIRRFPLMVTYRNKIFPSMSLEALSLHEQGFDPVPVKNEAGELLGMSLGSRLIPTNRQGEMIINYRGTEEQFRLYSATDLLQGKLDPKELSGKSVLIGATAIGIYDLRVTPVSPNLPGVLAQANLLDNLYQGDFLLQNDRTRLASLIIMLAVTLLLVVALPRLGMEQGLLLTGAFMAVYVGLVQWLFQRGWILSFITPCLQWLTVAFALTLYRGLSEERQKRTIRKAFQSYLHPDIVEELLHDPTKLKLGGQRAECTILFSDVRNFTGASEKMEPETLVQLMNEYFDPISQEIIREGGYIDKFIGDAVMAIFGAPKRSSDHALRACRAAVAIQKKAQSLAPLFQQKFGLKEFRIGVGIHTGPVVIGNIGTRSRLNYTVMGDAVNLASRLEGANKAIGTSILMSQETYEQVKSQVEARFVDKISLKGKEAAIPVYEVLRINASSVEVAPESSSS